MTMTKSYTTTNFDEARQSYSGRTLTDRQFNEAIAITDIIESEIREKGTFKDKLSDYAHAFARTENFDAARAESTLRDLFKLRLGQTMNDLRESLKERETTLELDETQTNLIKDKTREIAPLIKEGEKMPFYRAYSTKAHELAEGFGITSAGAKRLMTHLFRQETEGELYDWGKGIEDKYYRPQMEAKVPKQENAESTPSYSKRQSRSRSRRTGPRR